MNLKLPQGDSWQLNKLFTAEMYYLVIAGIYYLVIVGICYPPSWPCSPRNSILLYDPLQETQPHINFTLPQHI